MPSAKRPRKQKRGSVARRFKSHTRPTPAQLAVLKRLPLGARDVKKDVYRRMVYIRIIAAGWAEWSYGDVLCTTPLGARFVAKVDGSAVQS